MVKSLSVVHPTGPLVPVPDPKIMAPFRPGVVTLCCDHSSHRAIEPLIMSPLHATYTPHPPFGGIMVLWSPNLGGLVSVWTAVSALLLPFSLTLCITPFCGHYWPAAICYSQHTAQQPDLHSWITSAAPADHLMPYHATVTLLGSLQDQPPVQYISDHHRRWFRSLLVVYGDQFQFQARCPPNFGLGSSV